ncbi:MAG: SDR family oxidoreductase [Candidatus Omnitrophota bacterium]|nr:SDR family oxidoreductase [Candidatus Omnitrophota bacterium]
MKRDLFCDGLPTAFQPAIGKILVTGASGYIGGRLVPELLARGYKVRAMVRADFPEYHTLWPAAEIAAADALKMDSLRGALKGIDTAYYLIHSLRLGPRKFAAADIYAARNFRKAAEENNVKRIIYLGGLGDIRGPLSSHLLSRVEVAEELKRGKASVTILRAAIIVGSGSASYEIIQHLVKKLLVIMTPPWAKNRCQPIAIRDVIKYLVGVLETPSTQGMSYDIGGADILTYETMLKVLGGLLQKRAVFIPVPFSNTRLYAYITSLLTPVPESITACLMEGLKNEVVCQDESIRGLIPFDLLTYKEAIIRAMSREEQDKVYTRWSDASFPTHELALKLHELKNNPAHTAAFSLTTEKAATSLFRAVCGIGGKEGWFYSNWMWRLRGGIDRVLLGVGSARGRKSSSGLKINDVIDFWRVEDIQDARRLLLRAEMKLPGKAWLEFIIKDQGDKRELGVRAYYDTHTLFGKMYWYMCLPFHQVIFYNLIREIEKRS